VIGELLVGIIIVNTFKFDWLQLSGSMEIFDVLAELGIIVLLFTVGLETPISDLARVGRTATMVALLGVLVPFALGFTFILAYAGAMVEALFVGAAMVATSTGITARVLADLKATGSPEARIILGAAVIDDVMGMIVLTVVSGMSGGTLNMADMAVSIAVAVGFVIAAMVFGGRIIRSLSGMGSKEVYGVKIPLAGKDRLSALRQKNAPFIVALILCFGLSALANYLGLAAIIGAFLAGMAFAEVRDKYALREKMDPVNDLLVPFFFVTIGLQVHLGEFVPVLGVAMVITVLAVIGKFLGCYFASLRMGKRSATIVGIGMVPRGEVGIIVAVVGLSLSAIPNSMFSVVVFMSIATTIIVPPLLVWSFKRPDKPESEKINSRRKTAGERPSFPQTRKSVRELVSKKARRRK
jgi:Kef-type K+ transport system membrane component KefB